MEQPARFIITHVRWSSTPGHVAELRVLERTSDQFEDRGLMGRDQVIALLEDDEFFFVWDDEEENIGEELELVKVQGDKFLRTDGQRLRADNVDDLPEA
jgi:hypothetical protein